jgi:ABC-type nitrate/sulfonate/bicarbonate transport system substrate-binding protein
MVWIGGAQAGELTKVRFSYFPAFHTMAVYVAHQKGFFRDEGLDVQMIEAASGALQPIQLVAGDVEIASTELQNVVRLQHEGKKAIYIFDLVKRMSMDFVVHNDVLARAGVKPTDPLDKKLQSLRGLRIGYTSPNSPSDVYSRFYLQKAGLVPGKDAEMVSIGSPPSLVAALKTKRIDAFQLTAPTSTVVEKEGFGTAIIRGSAGEVKELDNYPYFGVIVMESYAAQHPDVVRGFIRATRRGAAFMRSDLEGTVQAVQAFFKRMSPEVLRAGVQTALPAYSNDGRLSEQIVTHFLELAYSMKLLTVPQRPSPKEGVLWTNRFIE